MQWNDDEYRDLKWMTFDLIRKNLYKGHQETITFNMLSDGIDKLFEDLIKDECDFCIGDCKCLLRQKNTKAE